jgi:hypothetical protein
VWPKTRGQRCWVFRNSSYQLTDPNSGAPVSDQAGSKQLQAVGGYSEPSLIKGVPRLERSTNRSHLA